MERLSFHLTYLFHLALDGASQVTWNKWKTDCLASCDGGHVKIWDIRKPTTPTEYIAAHASKINGKLASLFFRLSN